MKIDPRYSVLASEPGASSDGIAAALERFPELPREYVDLVEESTELELGWPGEIYLRIWGPSGCLEMDRAYGVSERITGAMPIGDNGGSEVLVYMEGSDGWGLYLVGFGDLDRKSAKWIAPSLSSLLSTGQGADLL